MHWQDCSQRLQSSIGHVTTTQWNRILDQELLPFSGCGTATLPVLFELWYTVWQGLGADGEHLPLLMADSL